MKEKRDDFSWLVALFERQKRDQNVRLNNTYTQQQRNSEKRKKRKELMSIMYLLIFALGVSLLWNPKLQGSVVPTDISSYIFCQA
jgi:cytoskeletal protein RodZ